MRPNAVWVALLVLAALAPLARATVGGPTLLEVLGWDPAEKRIWMHELPTHGGDFFGEVLYFDLDSDDSAALRSAGWQPAREGSAQDSVLARRLRSLRKGLVPLTAEAWPELPMNVRTVGSDSVLHMGVDRRVRTLVEVTFLGPDRYELQSYAPELGFSRKAWRIPGRPEVLAVLSYIGDRDEAGYEVQVPVLLRPGDSEPRRVRWRLERD